MQMHVYEFVGMCPGEFPPMGSAPGANFVCMVSLSRPMYHVEKSRVLYQRIVRAYSYQ